MAGNDWDKWSSPLRYNFIIERPFWQRPWFIAAAFIVLIIMIAFPFIYRIRHLLAIDRLRQKIAADLHDNIGSGLSEINILTAVIEIKIPEEFRDKTRIEREKISRRVEELTNGMSDIVWLVNPKNDSLFDLISRLSDSSTELLQNKNIRFNTHNMEQLKKIHLSMENRQHLLLLFKEAINNSLKYSNADKIDLEIEIKKGGYRISVRDNGDGFPANKAERGNGLNNMRLRASELKGRLEIRTSPGKGTEIIFYGKL
jgi:signal transduction histidine kinase